MQIAMVSGASSPLSSRQRTRDGQTTGLSAALARCGHRVTVYGRRDDPGLPDRVETPHGFDVVHVDAGPAENLSARTMLQHMGRFARYLHGQWTIARPDVVHVHSWVTGIPTQLAAKQLGIPVVQSFHALDAAQRRLSCAEITSPPERHQMERMLARQADWVVAACTEQVSELIRMGRPRARISVVPCGVDVDLFTPAGHEAPSGRRRRIVGIGSLVPRSGFDVVVRALPHLPNAELLIVGWGGEGELKSHPEARRLRLLAERLGIADRVLLCGSRTREQIPGLLQTADVVASTPWFDPAGIVAVEAMACGIPVVASAVGAMLDIVVPDVTGRLVKPRRPEAAVNALHDLIRDDFLRHSLGAAGRDRARSRYSWDRIGADTLRIYHRVAPDGHRGSADGAVRACG